MLGLGRLTRADIKEHGDSGEDVVQEPVGGSPGVPVNAPVEGNPKEAEDSAADDEDAVDGLEAGVDHFDEDACSQACYLRQDRHNETSQVEPTPEKKFFDRDPEHQSARSLLAGG